MSMLQKARDYEREYFEAYGQERPWLHLTPPVGWMNDPNGLCRFQGRYHLFFQYHPYSTAWGPMHWGHAVSDDLLTWEYLPCALAPDTPADAAGCFSGSALETEDGLMLVYTGVPTPERQTQCMAVGDGIDFIKCPENPVIDPDQLPDAYSRQDFRDPKVWKEADGYRMAVGNRHASRSGAILLMKSADARHWQLCGEIDSSLGINGRMWECPDFFPLDGQQVLVVSPQEMQENELFHQGYNAIALIGDFDGQRFNRQLIQPVDQGLDFYAPQTVLSPDGRRLMIGWMENWDYCKKTPRTHPWYGQMSLPREISLRDGRLIQRPAREMERYWQNTVCAEDTLVENAREYPGISGRALDMTLRLSPAEEACHSLTVSLAADEAHETKLICDYMRHEIIFDRRKSGGIPEAYALHRVPVPELDAQCVLRLVLDKEGVEIFLNDGERAFSYRLFTPMEAQGVRFSAQGKIQMSCTAHLLSQEIKPGNNA